MNTTGQSDEIELPDVTDEQLEQSLATARPYTIVVLKAGPRFQKPGPDRDPEVARIIWAHGKRNYALRLAGLLPIVCPVADGSDVTGIAIFDATPEDVELIISGDPGIKAGLFTFDVHPTRTFPGSTLPQ